MQVSCGGCVDRLVWTSYSHFRPTLWGQFLMLIEIRGQDCVSGARAVYQGQADLVWGTYGFRIG